MMMTVISLGGASVELDLIKISIVRLWAERDILDISRLWDAQIRLYLQTPFSNRYRSGVRTMIFQIIQNYFGMMFSTSTDQVFNTNYYLQTPSHNRHTCPHHDLSNNSDNSSIKNLYVVNLCKASSTNPTIISMIAPMICQMIQKHRKPKKSNACPRGADVLNIYTCLLYTSPSPRDRTRSRMPSSA